ncbi:TPA: WhiB family transcriptional regulator [Corynebacterium striatum]|uniref:WhiB family transcriptional regulator n=1 Tax=Corynebacterium striatum TaxID=43770 RepID=UPI0014192EE1|nr:WhiB family transcriptional regulator [Corynebacterium striatum]NHX52983.1 WhiB family transcriptional regulator [Corynebacterium striatum]NHY37595.1 WhiB family transcriptional regulator [Corynebacterium striatum]HAT1133941.1 WhiB family transcriptional regulator [Corynebacterium striatum]HAT1239910.1 WhiB family transcriptional regulator [Corynebacterium striatum]HAT1243332.1 WhiB family transcriptional regulator [Corynebacterium striatum]
MTTTIMNPEWRYVAKCAGDDVNTYDLESRRIIKDKAAVARELCAGCPVKAECAADALRFDAWGTVRAGIWLPNSQLMDFQKREYLNVLKHVAMGEDA